MRKEKSNERARRKSKNTQSNPSHSQKPIEELVVALPKSQISKKSTRKEQYYTKKQLNDLRNGDRDLKMSKDQAMYIIQQGWELIDKAEEKNKHFTWRWSGLNHKESLQAIIANYLELTPVIRTLKEGRKTSKKTQLPTTKDSVVDYNNSKLIPVPVVVHKERVAMMIDYEGKYLHFGDGEIDLSLKINQSQYKTINPSEYVVVWIKTMNTPFALSFEKLPWADGEEVMVDGNIPWKKTKLVLPTDLENHQGVPSQSLVHFTDGEYETNQGYNTLLEKDKLAQLRQELNNLSKMYEDEKKERSRQQKRARSLEDSLAKLRDRHLAFAKELQDAIESSDPYNIGKNKHTPAKDTISVAGQELRPTDSQQRLLQSKRPRAAIRELMIIVKDHLKIDLERKQYYMPGFKVEENEVVTKINAKQLDILMNLVGKYIWMFKGSDSKTKRKAIRSSLEFSRQIYNGIYKKGLTKSKKNYETERIGKRKKVNDESSDEEQVLNDKNSLEEIFESVRSDEIDDNETESDIMEDQNSSEEENEDSTDDE